MNLPSDPLFYIVAVLAVVLVGLAKGGFAGLGTASMPLMTLVMSPVAAAAMLLPLFIVQDVVGVWAYRRTFDARTLAITLPGGALGTFLGWWLASSVSVWVVEAAVGAIALWAAFSPLPAAAALLMPALTLLTAWTVVNRVRHALAEAGA